MATGIDVQVQPPAVKGGSFIVSNIPIGPVALASIGTNTTGVVQLWVTELFLPCNRDVTKIGFLQGGTATTDKALCCIYNSAGALVASAALAGVLLSGANTFAEQAIALDGSGNAITSVSLVGPAQYFVGVQLNGTTAGDIQTVPAPYLLCANSVTAGSFGTLPATITPPTTFTAGKGPIVYLK